ncbi:T9SS type A sorting domain-containing protein [Chryseobacterium sp. LC2016-29]|uniref:T9SS type A sorting domain-containing protein n=1 Tax=Chryseobacterium sp. LC2016-29 TaxID=2897331 RepID=UPI001E554114|nr:T9SS type A sorting domain-containing protein [Chryseobacterium sp. LC2016-29]MCD0480038.1 T9SS type A sorting domain-containing protein [Chryseobacterium sp. LC2016-29]
MKKIFLFLAICNLFYMIVAQSDQYPRQCVTQIKESSVEIVNAKKNLINCGNTSPYYNQNFHNNPLYIPQQNDDNIYIRLNFIFPTKPDGTGNFEENNPEHIEFLDNLITQFNLRLQYLQAPSAGCENSTQQIWDTKIRVIVNKIWKVDPAWDYLVTGFNPANNNPYDNNGVLIPGPNYHYSYYDTDSSIPVGLNIVFANNGNLYQQYQSGNINNAPLDWAVSEFPDFTQFNSKLRQFWPDLYNGYLRREQDAIINAGPNFPTFETIKQWFYTDIGARAMVHELGHNFRLQHHDCGGNIMSYNSGSHDYLSVEDVSFMFQNASISNVRQYFTPESFKNTYLNVNSNQLWDINFRNYNTVKIDNNSILKTTCKLIMAPESRVVVKSGSAFVIEGAEISSANEATWNGIKIEGNGYCLILPDTEINNNYFYAYTDNSVLKTSSGFNPEKSLDNTSKKKIESKNETNNINEVKIFPNPTGDFINIEVNEKTTLLTIYNLSGQKVFNSVKDLKRINVQNLPSGMYLLEIKTDSKIITKKFIKK